jgi:phosphoglycerate kinase
MPMLKMSDLNLSGKRLLIRADLNVPIKNGQITSRKRIEAILPTLHIALKQNAKIILMSHLGRPQEGVYDPALSLAPIASCLSDLLKRKVNLVKEVNAEWVGEAGEIHLLENIRFFPGEKENEPGLGKKLAGLCDIFVMDAFATAHRKEASTYRVAEFAPIACAGPLLVAEIDALARLLEHPTRPLVAVVGGAKVATKLSALKSILSLADSLILGGGILNTFLVSQGISVGKSLYDTELVYEAKQMVEFARSRKKCLPLPKDVVVGKHFSPDTDAIIKQVDRVTDEYILDLGPESMRQICPLIQAAGTILWNGPVGIFEWPQFGEGTRVLAEAVKESGAYSVVGGGDTLAAMEKYNAEEGISYVSTGGGAFLAFLTGEKLPGIAILEQRCEYA